MPSSGDLISPAKVYTKKDLFAIKNEFDVMYWQGQLGDFLQSGIIVSINDLRMNIEEAYSYAYAAGEEKSNRDHRAASRSINRCHDHIQRTIVNILITL